MIKKTMLTLFIMSCAFVLQATAQTSAATAISPEKQAAIKELIAIITTDNKVEDLVKLVASQMDSMRESTIDTMLDERADLSAAERKALRESLISDQKAAAQRFQEKMIQKLNFDEMLIEISTIVYDKYYTLEEIRELTVFYRTTTGQKTLKTMQPLMADIMTLTQERLVPKIPVVIKEIQEEEKMEIERQINVKKPKRAGAGNTE